MRQKLPAGTSILTGFTWISMQTKNLLCILLLAAIATRTIGQTSYNSVRTYLNPVLPGDHPDPTLLKVGDDFYHCGSSFHFNPYLPVYHSKDLVHWKIISR